MEKLNIETWRKIYQKDDQFAFGSQPNAWLERVAPLFDFNCKILDVGCGEGLNALYLEALGFQNIDAFDLSLEAISKLRRLSKKHVVNAWVEDIRDFQFTKDYDVILSFGTLHFLEPELWKQFLGEAKLHTVPGGFHMIQMMTNTLPATEDIAPYAKGFADDGALRDVYDDWNEDAYMSYIIDHEHPGLPYRHQHSANKILVKKPKPVIK